MKIKEIRTYKLKKQVNKIEVTGRIVSNKENSVFGDEIYAIHPFGNDSLVPLVVETSTTQTILTDDGSEDTRKYMYNVNVYGDLIDKVTDNSDFYVGCRVKVTGYLISKNFCKTEERADIMNLCNRYKNLNDGEKPIGCKMDKKFLDKDTGLFLDKYYINWDALLEEGLLMNIPEEEEQDLGKVEYCITEEGKVYRLEPKTNYIIMAKDIEVIDSFMDTNIGDMNKIEISGTAKNVTVKDLGGYQSGYACIVSNTNDMTRNSYIHVTFKGKNLDVLKRISIDDEIKVKGKLKHRVISKTFSKIKGKKELTWTIYTNVYEVECRTLEIYKNN